MAGGSTADIGTGLVALSWTLFSVAFVVVCLRVWTRVIYLKDRMALHDWLMVCAVISEICHVALLHAGRNAGLGRHAVDLTPSQITLAEHYIVAVQSFSVITSCLGRISFAYFLISIIGATNKALRNTLYVLIVIQVIVNSLVVIQVYTQCGSKLAALWNPEIAQTAHCLSPDVETYLGYCQASLNSLCDLALTILPLVIVWGMNLPKSTKLGLGALLCLSSFALVASVAKAVEIRLLSSGPDFTWNFAILQYCVVVECDVVIIAATIPMLRALFRKSPTDESSGQFHSGYTWSSSVATRKAPTFSNREDEEYMLSALTDRGIRRTTEMEVFTSFSSVQDKDKDIQISIHSVH